jgi:valyl-tRNA synthetase
VIDPLQIVDEYGADALRFTNAAMASIGGVLKLSEERIAGYRNFGTKLWNAARFAEMNEAVAGAVGDAIWAPGKPMPEAAVNRWIIGETARTRAAVDEALAAYRFNDAASTLYGFVWGMVCDWYVELSKPLLMDGSEAEKAETRAVMAWVIDQCLLLLHPFMPFVTEELWGTLGARPKMLVHGDWPDYAPGELVDAEASAEMGWVIGLIEAVRSARGEMRVPVGLKVPLVEVDLSDAGRAYWTRNAALIQRLARIDSLTKADAMPKGAVTIAVEGATLGLPLEGIIDIDAEKARLEKALEKLGKELGGLRGRLGNPKFVESAPEDIVEETRAQLAAKEEEAGRLEAARARLAELG